MLLRNQRLKLIRLAIVILFCYSMSSIFKEKVLRRPYGDGEGERFTFAFAFTAVQCVIYAAVAKAVIVARKHPENETPQRYFCIIGVFYVLSKVTSYMSLRYVPYPTQVVGKSSKPIPIMLLGVLIGRKSYTVYKYIFVTIIVIGVVLFSFKEKYDKKDGEDPILGIIFIAVSLLMDGFLGAFEDRMRSVKKPTALNLMLFMNSWNSLYVLTYLVTTNEGIEFFQFCQRHPIVIRDLSVVVVFGIFGQFCITSMIANFGALPLSITTTIRKFFTVLLSVLIFNNVLSVRQWIAATIIFLALFLDGYFSKRMKKKESGDIEGRDNGTEDEKAMEIRVNAERRPSILVNPELRDKSVRKTARISFSEDDCQSEEESLKENVTKITEHISKIHENSPNAKFSHENDTNFMANEISQRISEVSQESEIDYDEHKENSFKTDDDLEKAIESLIEKHESNLDCINVCATVDTTDQSPVKMDQNLSEFTEIDTETMKLYIDNMLDLIQLKLSKCMEKPVINSNIEEILSENYDDTKL